jgi:hypothetical protein
MTDLIDGSSDLRNQNIEINPVDDNGMNNNNNNNSNNNNNTNNIQNQIENKIGEKIVQSATEQFSKTWIDKYFCCLNLVKKYFDIESSDFYKRFLGSLIPFNKGFHDIIGDKPDLYGPFWIYATLVLVIAASGSLTRFIEGDSTKNFFEEFIPIACIIIYCIGFGLPIVLTLLMKAFGSSEIQFSNVICTYGYSYSVYIPAVILCCIDWQPLQWILLGYAAFSSTSLLIVNYFKEVNKYSSNGKKYLIIILVLLVQIGMFLIFKFYFFKKLTQEINNDDSEGKEGK